MRWTLYRAGWTILFSISYLSGASPGPTGPIPEICEPSGSMRIFCVGSFLDDERLRLLRNSEEPFAVNFEGMWGPGAPRKCTYLRSSSNSMDWTLNMLSRLTFAITQTRNRFRASPKTMSRSDPESKASNAREELERNQLSWDDIFHAVNENQETRIDKALTLCPKADQAGVGDWIELLLMWKGLCTKVTHGKEDAKENIYLYLYGTTQYTNCAQKELHRRS